MRKEKEKRKEKGKKQRQVIRTRGMLWNRSMRQGGTEKGPRQMEELLFLGSTTVWVITFGGKEFWYPRPKEWLY